ncbi:nucleotidyltransferase domain-containing protein [Gracilibacillus timonensis]|uniref:nucleotidyltransferase domain-containing protein n=1 Tax=Gracilibacillus timonensis TaxID=1816696 RepID=UPI000826930C|nr:nucleotidyltransferase domain-containing protein [Gracilibacillus timonensis]
MVNKSVELLQVAQDFIKDKEVIGAYVGGSVGRGEADEYSDIDLTIFTNTETISKKIDVIYKDEIIQLEILHISELPHIVSVEASPWDFRFLDEVTIIKDEDGELNKIKKMGYQLF